MEHIKDNVTIISPNERENNTIRDVTDSFTYLRSQFWGRSIELMSTLWVCRADPQPGTKRYWSPARYRTSWRNIWHSWLLVKLIRVNMHSSNWYENAQRKSNHDRKNSPNHNQSITKSWIGETNSAHILHSTFTIIQQHFKKKTQSHTKTQNHAATNLAYDSNCKSQLDLNTSNNQLKTPKPQIPQHADSQNWKTN